MRADSEASAAGGLVRGGALVRAISSECKLTVRRRWAGNRLRGRFIRRSQGLDDGRHAPALYTSIISLNYRISIALYITQLPQVVALTVRSYLRIPQNEGIYVVG